MSVTMAILGREILDAQRNIDILIKRRADAQAQLNDINLTIEANQKTLDDVRSAIAVLEADSAQNGEKS